MINSYALLTVGVWGRTGRNLILGLCFQVAAARTLSPAQDRSAQIPNILASLLYNERKSFIFICVSGVCMSQVLYTLINVLGFFYFWVNMLNQVGVIVSRCCRFVLCVLSSTQKPPFHPQFKAYLVPWTYLRAAKRFLWPLVVFPQCPGN